MNGNRIRGSGDKLSDLPWNDPSIKIVVPTQHTAAVVAATTQMFKAIKDLVFKEDLIRIFTKIAEHFAESYVGIFLEIEIQNKTGAQR